MTITPGGLDDPRVQALLAHHVKIARSETGRCSAHALDLDALRAPDIMFYSAWNGDTLLGVGALKRLTAARALYKRCGFIECGPFGDYAPDPNSVFMTLDLTKASRT